MANVTSTGGSGAKGMSIGSKLTLTFLLFILILAGALALIYQKSVPPLMQEQIALRTEAIAKPLSTSVLEPLAIRDYLRVNSLARVAADLPGVAYVAVINQNNKAAAGLYGDIKRFDQDFVRRVSDEGFPVGDLPAVELADDGAGARNELQFGGKRIVESASTIGSSDATVRVGLFTEDIEATVFETLIPLLILLGVMAVLGVIVMMFLASSISRPIRKLAEEAHAISLGKLDQEIDVKGGREIGELAGAFSRMQASIKYSMEQLKR